MAEGGGRDKAARISSSLELSLRVGEEGEGDGQQTPQNHVRVTDAESPMEETERDVGTKC